ncbi:MAG: PfkB family carbohydrate kinase [Vicinamibacteria bacterium]|nr:PfkB family carbohydrate kinase [Vicinamibacteria bacterium]
MTWDEVAGRDVLGGAVSYAALAARKLGWEVAVLTSAGPDFDPARELPGVDVRLQPAPRTTRFVNTYPGGERHQRMPARAADLDPGRVPDAWRRPDALLLAPVAGELGPGFAHAFEAAAVGAIAQGYLRATDDDGQVHPVRWRDPAADLAGVHLLSLSEQDLGAGGGAPSDLLRYVPLVALTRGWQGAVLLSRGGEQPVASLPRPEVDPTGAGDVFAATLLLRYHETGDPLAAVAFACCAASCAVEGVGTSTLGDRAEVERRLAARERWLEEGEWDE